jgi:hypothetical protein
MPRDALGHLRIEGLGRGDHDQPAAGFRRSRLGGRLGEGALAGSGSAQDEGKRQDALQIARSN